MLGTSRINHNFDLLSLVERDVNLKKSGAWYAGPCPFCGGVDRFVLKKTNEGWRWFCRGCGDGKYHSTIDYIMRREGLNFQDALKWAGGGVIQRGKQTKKKVIRSQDRTTTEPTPVWRERALAFVKTCESALWSDAGVKALEWLHARGLKRETLQDYRIGYHPAQRFESLEKWGLPEELNRGGNPRKVWLPRGIVVPCFTKNGLWYIKFRLPLTKSQIRNGAHKYIKVKGSKPGIYGAENLRGAWLGVLTEGEFDAMLLDQEVGDAVGAATLGSTSDRLTRLDMAVWGRYLFPLAHILAAYGLDEGGEQGIKALERFTGRVSSAPLPDLPNIKDVTDLYQTGIDLWKDWLANHITNLSIVEKPESLLDAALRLPGAVLTKVDNKPTADIPLCGNNRKSDWHFNETAI